MSEGPEPFLRLTWTDPVTGRKGYVVIDRLVNGLAGGGTRMRAGVTLEEVERLARTMSLKNGAVTLPGGGAKGGLDCDPHDPEARALLTRFVRAVRPLLESYWGTAEDMGTTQQLLDEVFVEVGMQSSVQAALNHSGDGAAALRRLVEGLGVQVGGIGLGDLVGGYGVAQAAAAAAQHQGRSVQGLRAVIQGFGAMGGSTARYLVEQGARVVALSDVRGTVTNPAGLDVERLLATRTALGDIDRSALRPDDRELARDEWLSVDADVLVPAAVADSITAENCSGVKAWLVVEAANIPTTEEAQRLLHQRGVLVIPDYVANGGTNAWFWWVLLGMIEPTAEAAFRVIGENMRRSVADMLELADRDDLLPREAADVIAMRNLDRLAEEYGAEVPPPRPASA
ncbi:Glu/Leu/Phe/Val dehydrogenase dimerization domain-containing protein [Candidatus Nephthysia bennettiae]|uniref:Glutamate dehydrogenase n=1 Tax=Candidatus Nephthysia bennettiae TaxID=3127016 RepID=A0A934K7T4_9BACT|nr:Glu/Leu/Phe/Val dehydrogenase [Candidatus Dormibacteraeota bacterium]MBJ7613520.1 Glu/Leu/Phe/Val dehydrogenase [Candidatus Dormibacteraeota bacterium]